VPLGLVLFAGLAAYAYWRMVDSARRPVSV
jgi:hypothetical protein